MPPNIQFAFFPRTDKEYVITVKVNYFENTAIDMYDSHIAPLDKGFSAHRVSINPSINRAMGFLPCIGKRTGLENLHLQGIVILIPENDENEAVHFDPFEEGSGCHVNHYMDFSYANLTAEQLIF